MRTCIRFLLLRSNKYTKPLLSSLSFCLILWHLCTAIAKSKKHEKENDRMREKDKKKATDIVSAFPLIIFHFHSRFFSVSLLQLKLMSCCVCHCSLLVFNRPLRSEMLELLLQSLFVMAENLRYSKLLEGLKLEQRRTKS